jgi:hypothetical protein
VGPRVPSGGGRAHGGPCSPRRIASGRPGDLKARGSYTLIRPARLFATIRASTTKNSSDHSFVGGTPGDRRDRHRDPVLFRPRGHGSGLARPGASPTCGGGRAPPGCGWTVPGRHRPGSARCPGRWPHSSAARPSGWAPPDRSPARTPADIRPHSGRTPVPANRRSRLHDRDHQLHSADKAKATLAVQWEEAARVAVCLSGYDYGIAYAAPF